MKIIRNLALVTVILITVLVVSSFSTTNTMDYDKKWEEVKSLADKGRPQSALAIVKEIYSSAKDSDNKPQIIKSLIYQASLSSKFEEDYMVKSIDLFKSNLKDATVPEKQLLESLLAEIYQSYYNANRWTINKLEITDDDNPDITTWDAVKFNKVISELYISSVNDRESLSNIALKIYSDILIHADSSETTLSPYLYDLLANRAINYFSSPDYELATIGTQTDGDIESFLIPASDFIDIKINPASSDNKVLWLYQRLIRLHSNKNNVEALVDTDLKRLKFVYSRCETTQKTQDKYLNILNQMAGKFRAQPVYSDIAYELANLYYQLASDYSPEFNTHGEKYLVISDSICSTVIDSYPLYDNTNKCRNLKEIINRVDFNFDMPVAVSPESPILALIEYKNIDKLYFKIVEGDAIANADRHNHKEYINRELRKKSIISWTQELPVVGDHRQHTAEVSFPALNTGYYVLLASDDPDFSTTKTIRYSAVSVSNMSYILNENPEGEFNDIYVLNRETGKTIGLVKITVYSQRYENRTRSYTINKVASLQTDNYGYAKIDPFTGNNYGTYLFEFEKDGEKLYSENYMSFFRQQKSDKPKVTTYFFTDRGIYRPGQTVYFKGIVVEKLNEDIKLLTENSQEVSFINASRKKIKSINIKTDETGSFDGSFTIPMGMMNGNMTIKTKTGSVRVKVENYKRPTFKVEFKPVDGELKINDNVKIKGSTVGYAGNAVTDAKVSYKVVRNVFFPWPLYRSYYRWFPPMNRKEVEIASGEVISGENGEFEFDFIAVPDDKIPGKTNPVFTYQISVEVTDITGEVQANNTSVNISSRSLILEVNIPEVIENSNLKDLTITCKNINKFDVKAEASIELFKITPPERLLSKRQIRTAEFHTISEEVFKKEFPHEVYKNEGDPFSWPKEKISELILTLDGKTMIPNELFASLEIGEYMIMAKAKNSNGEEIEIKHKFTVFSTTGKKLPGSMINWFTLDKNTALPGEVVKLVVGSAAKNSQLLYEIIAGNKIINRNWVKLSRKQQVIEIPVTEEYRGNFSINLVMVRYNRIYTRTLNIKVPFSNKKLDIKLETFRNHLTPGQKEEWKVSISGENANGIAANLLAGMYDASLDVFASNNWDMSLYHSRRPASAWESNQFHSSMSSALFTPETKFHKKKAYYYPAINWFGFRFMGYYPVYYDQSDMLYKKSMISRDQTASGASMLEENSEIIEDKDLSKTELNISDNESETIPIRSNFNETAFFYPNLKTDSEGNVSFGFTSPDALTEWKIMMLAYTGELKVGKLEQNIKSQKEIMIIPNVPRFLRHGDTIRFTAKVINFTDKVVKANTFIEFFDGVTMDGLNIMLGESSGSISSEINPGQSISVSWEIAIPDHLSMLAYRIISKTDKFSDGEERFIPILTNRMLVTNSMPMNVGASSTRVFDFKSVYESNSSTKRNYKYTVEFASNPSWYAVQAIPYLSKPKNNSSRSLFNMYYANSLSSYIINSNPKIKTVFESWKNTTPDAFLSNLEKNAELKNIILEATPWVLDAEDESEQKRRIAVLFDLNRLKDEKDFVLDKLMANQLNSGAWPWFKGMTEDINTTQEIVIGMARLHNKGVIDISSDNRRLQMIRKAVNFLDNRIVKAYDDHKKNHPKTMSKYHINSYQTRYLYARALLIELFPIKDNSQEAFDYYTNQAKKYWLKQSNYLQGMTAITLNKLGHRNESEAIIRSLKERSLYSKEMGMYWRYEKGWAWYQAPVETQAMMIETMAELDNNPTLIEQMKIWLLLQKQTQNWKTSSATAEAIFALLMYGNNTLDNDDLVDISVGGETIDISGNPDNSSEAGTGYFTHTWSGSEITKDFANISVINPNNNIAWGAVYYQYFEDMDKIDSHSTPLGIHKTLYKEQDSENGSILVKITEDDILEPGDKVIVRLQISTDRDMDYVHVKDMRASTFEPVSGNSGYSYDNGLWYYKNITDVGTSFFIQHLRKGDYIIEYPLFVTQTGDFTNGIASIQCIYAPEFGANTGGLRISVK